MRRVDCDTNFTIIPFSQSECGMNLRYFYYLVRDCQLLLKKECRLNFPLSLYRRVTLFFQGFLSEKYTLYNLSENNRSEFLSDFHAARARWVNEPYTEILSNKLIFERVVGSVIRVPKTHAVIDNGRVVMTDYSGQDCDGVSSLIDLARLNPLIIKPVSGGGGAGINQLEMSESRLLLNGCATTPDELTSFVSKLSGYMVSERIEQGAFSRGLNPGTVNCLRIVTLYDDDNRCAFIVRAVHRVGVMKSKPFDNFTRGGLSFEIDLHAGTLSAGTSHPESTEAVWHSRHPDSGVQIEGLQMEAWPQVKDAVENAANQLPYLKCIGWDILVTEDGPVAIEGNHHPDPDVLQCHGGILADERVRSFYVRYGIV